MKLLPAALALVTLGCVWAGSTPPLEGVWHEGADKIPPVETETNVDGEVFKTQFIAAIDKYLKELDGVIDRQDFWSTVSITQNCDRLTQEIIDKQHLVVTGIATSTEFDYDLRFLSQEFARVVELVQFGYNIINTRRNVGGQTRLYPRIYSPRYDLNEMFYHFGNQLLANDFSKIQSWATKTFDQGYSNVRLEADIMEKDYRTQYLWPMVKKLQQDARSIEQYDEGIGNHSTSIEWVTYKMVRQELYNLPLDF